MNDLLFLYVVERFPKSIILKKYSSDVVLIEKDNNKYIIKRMLDGLTKEMLFCQKQFIDFLFERKVNVARIIDIDFFNNIYFEIIEYIQTETTHYCITSVISEIAKMHNASNDFSLSYNIPVISAKTIIRGTTFDKILLGFKEKYCDYPLNTINAKKQYYDNESRIYIDNIIQIYQNIYQNFTNENNIERCICHNDISTQNVIFKNRQCYLLDFDFLTLSSEYVDLVDAIIFRNLSLKNIHKIVTDNNLDKIRKIYHKENHNIILDNRSIKQMIFLKIISFHFYIKASHNNLTYSDLKLLQNILFA